MFCGRSHLSTYLCALGFIWVVVVVAIVYHPLDLCLKCYAVKCVHMCAL